MCLKLNSAMMTGEEVFQEFAQSTNMFTHVAPLSHTLQLYMGCTPHAPISLP
jgi:hypothetical protein